MDPQQRVLLEEAAGLLATPDSAGSSSKAGSGLFLQQTAVAVGMAKLGEPPVVAAGTAAATLAGSSYVGTGRALSAAAGRLSYCFGLKGPSGGWRGEGLRGHALPVCMRICLCPLTCTPSPGPLPLSLPPLQSPSTPPAPPRSWARTLRPAPSWAAPPAAACLRAPTCP